MTYIFADCTLDTRLYSLRRAGRSLRLPPKVFQVLLYLLEHRDHVVSKQELCEQAWPQQFISNAALESCIRLVRLSVGDNGHVQEVIQTHRGHGYRFVATVDVRPVIHMGRTPQTASAALVPPAVPTREPRLPALAPTPALHQPGVPADFLGPRRTPQCPACQHANREDAAFCAACGTRLRQPCASCGRDVPLPAVFCIACGKPLPVLALLPAVFPAAGMLGPSGEVSMPPVRAAIGEERKPVTVLCCSVAHAATDRAHLDLDALHGLMQDLYSVVQEVMQQYDGTLQPVIGERLLVMFGAPTAQEDHAWRAVWAALDLRQRVYQGRDTGGTGHGTALTVRIGLHTGLVVVGGRTNSAGTVTAVVGHVVSLAVALQERAEPGMVLCSDATAHLVRGAVHLEALGPIRVAEQPMPVLAYAVLGHGPRRSFVEQHQHRALSPFVGRECELATLYALLAQAEKGWGQVVGVVGEEGLGKSRLLYEFRHSLRSRRLTYLAGRCLSYGRRIPFLPILDLLRHHCGITEMDVPELITAKVHSSLQELGMAPETWAPILLHLLNLPAGTEQVATLSPEVCKAHALAALIQMCLNSCLQRPLILEVEDLHWIDATSDECLTTLVERMAGVPLLLVVTYRPGYRPAWLDKSYVTQVAL